MGLRFRKSYKVGGARINLSKSGVGYSVGGKGFRATKKASGGYRTTASVPGTGISYTKDYSSSRRSSGRSAERAVRSKNSQRICKGTWGIIGGVVLLIGVSIVQEESLIANWCYAICACACLWWGLATRRNYNYVKVRMPRPETVENLMEATDEELLEARQMASDYIQAHDGHPKQTDDMVRLMKAIRQEERRRAGLEPDFVITPPKRSKRSIIITASLCAVLSFAFALGITPGAEQDDVPLPEPAISTDELPELESEVQPELEPEVQPEPESEVQITYVYISDTGSKYHRSGCSSLRKSKIEITLDDAVARGYTPCERCH